MSKKLFISTFAIAMVIAAMFSVFSFTNADATSTSVETKSDAVSEIRLGKIDPLDISMDRFNNNWYRVYFNKPFANSEHIIVLAQTQTRNGQDTPGLRIKNVTPTSFMVRYDEVIWGDSGVVYGSSGTRLHGETVGWVAYGYK